MESVCVVTCKSRRGRCEVARSLSILCRSCAVIRGRGRENGMVSRASVLGNPFCVD